MEHALDFWLGRWDCEFDGGRASNTITREFAGHVVVERFRMVDGEPFEGLSVSVFTPTDQQWRQTWVDTHGGYWALVGSALPSGGFEFRTPERVDAEQVFKRMVFSNIEPDGFDWRWEFSPDEVAWDLRWAIRYERVRD